jgi:DNA-binding beta-propeller fold protein YncE
LLDHAPLAEMIARRLIATCSVLGLTSREIGMLRLMLACCALCFFGTSFVRAQPVLRATLTAELGYYLSRPHDGAFSPDGTRIYVTDMEYSLMRVLDAESLRPIDTFGRDELSQPHDAVFDHSGRLLVADTGNDRIAIYAVDDGHARLVGELKGLAGPEGVGVAPDGRIYATNTRTASVSVFRGGKLERTVGEYGSAAGQFSRPHDIDVDRDGRVYVVDSGNHRVQVFDAELNHLMTSSPALGLHEPKYLAFDGDRIWLADEDNHRIVLLDRELQVLGVLGGGGPGRAPVEFRKPEAVLARAPFVWVIDTYNDRVVRLRIVH